MKLLSAATVLAALTSCSAGESATRAPAGRLPQLRIANRNVIDSLLPPKYARDASRLLYPCLLKTGPGGGALPDLARAVPSQADGSISSDGLTIDYHLRHDLHWSDGAPLTADDVVFTERAVMASANLYPFQAGYKDATSMTAPDRYTVRVRMKNVDSPILHRLFAQNFCFGVIPKHIYRDFTHLARVPEETPVVAGPFVVDRWVRGDRLELKPNTLYFDGPPHIRVLIKYVEDSNTIVAQMRSGELDADLDASASEAANLKSDPRFNVQLTTAPNVHEIIVNTADPILRDVRFRRALVAAIDRQSIAKRVSFGYYDASMVAPAIFGWAHDPSLQEPPYDLQRANSLLDELGWRRGANGMRSRNGTPLQLLLVSSAVGLAPRVDVQLQNALASAGIDVIIKTVDEAQLFGDVTPHAKFQLLYLNWSFQGWDGDLTALIGCDQRPPAGGNYGHFCDPQLDAALRAGYSTFNSAARRKNYATVQRLFYNDVPHILLWGAPTIDIYTKRLKFFTDAYGDPTAYHSNKWELAPR